MGSFPRPPSRRDAHLAQITATEQRLAAAQQATEMAAQDHIDIRRRRTEGMAAELAASLADGAPCPVCGSCSHPAPATALDGQPTREDEQAAEQTHQRAQQQRDAIASELQQLRENAATATGEAGDTPLADLTAEHEALTTQLTDALQRAADRGAADEELLAMDREHSAMTQQLNLATAGLSARNATYDTQSQRQAELTKKLDDARGTAPTLAARIDELTRTADHLKQAAEASRAAAIAAETRGTRTTEATAAASTQGFDTLAAAEQALLSEEDLGNIEEEINQWREARATHQAVLDNPALQQAAAQPPADVDAAAVRRGAADDQYVQAAATASNAQARTTELTDLAATLGEAVERLEALDKAHSTARHLADLATGNSTSARVRMQLEAYVLAARLEQVVAAANTRLGLMSEGRYTLRHSDHQAAHGARSGLGLEITDAWTGRPRKTDTLSGGESFFASLSLALGLADVVTHEVGGNPLDTLFIDEGFGTLDDDTLHKVLDVLDSLRAHDRTVGVISHVPELRRRILQALRAHDDQLADRLAVPQQPAALTLEDEEEDNAPPVDVVFDRPFPADTIAQAFRLRVLYPRDASFRRGLEAATAYYESHGHLDVPQLHDDENGFALGRWVNRMRKAYAAGTLKPRQVKALHQIGMIWNLRSQAAERGLLHARGYAERHGHLAVPTETMIGDFAFGRWLTNRRRTARARADDGLEPDPTDAALAEIDPWWNPPWPISWQRLYYAARIYAEASITLDDLPPDFLDDNDEPIGEWVRTQSQTFHTLPPEQARLVTELGITPFDPAEPATPQLTGRAARQQRQLDHGLAAVEAFRAREGHIHIRQRDTVTVDGEEFKIGQWLNNLRKRWDDLPEEHLDAVLTAGLTRYAQPHASQ